MKSAILPLFSILAIAQLHAQSNAQAENQWTQVTHTAQAQYYSQFGKYATNLAELGPPAGGNATASAADLISGDLASGEKSGYKYTLEISPKGYNINGIPVTFNVTGSRTFYSNESMIVFQNFGPEPATAQSQEVK